MTPISREVSSTSYIPNTTQTARAAALRRFNWLYIYTPIIVFSLVVLVLIVLLLWGVLSPNVVGTEAFVSGLADVIIILFSLPLMILCAVGPIALVALIVFYVKRRRDPTAVSLLGRLQGLLWRLDIMMAKVLVKTRETAPAVAEPVIRAHAGAAYLNRLKNHLKRMLTRS